MKRILKGEVDPKNLFEAMKTSFNMIPEDPMALEPFAKQKRQAEREASKKSGGIAGSVNEVFDFVSLAECAGGKSSVKKCHYTNESGWH